MVQGAKSLQSGAYRVGQSLRKIILEKTVATKTENFVQHWLTLGSQIVKLPIQHIWIDYDREADVLYLSFRKPQRATKTIETDDELLIRKEGNKIVGITILNASTR
jgi:uncharacterized protein YuzE